MGTELPTASGSLANAWLGSLLLLLVVSCGPALPKRFVLERDIAELSYRRYQKVLDVEFAVSDNPAVGHTAAYVLSDASEPLVCTAFVTRYKSPRGVARALRNALGKLASYEVNVEKVHGDQVWRVSGEREWLVWVSGAFLVKLGAPLDEDLPESLIKAYQSLYDSDLNSDGISDNPVGEVGGDAAADDDDDFVLDRKEKKRR